MGYVAIASAFRCFLAGGQRIIAALPGATSLFVGDDNLLLRRIDDEYGQQPSRLRRAGVGTHLMVVSGHLRPAFSCLIDMLGLVVDFGYESPLPTQLHR